MSLPALRVQWRKGTYATVVTLCTTLHTSLTKFAPCVLLRHLVLKISLSIVVHLTDGFSEVFPESSNSQSERQVSLSVETSMPELFLFGNF